MQLDSFKLATKKGNTLLWIYNINHIYQNVSFIYGESWNKSWPDKDVLEMKRTTLVYYL